MSEEDLSRPLTGVLAQLTRDLTADARAERLEPVRCRDAEISRVIDILLRHGKNNPALVGPSGVGKTAIAEGLAQRLSGGGGNVPLALRNARVLALDHVSLLAGTSYRGQYEERIRALVAEVSADPDVILFVDELHNLIGQGTAIGVAMDAANMLKPALVRGDFRVIGATTNEEYERWICGDPALERRFQKVLVNELSSEQTAEILEARRLRLERHHNVVISDESVRAAIAITDEHQTDRRRPDRAIDALDEACAHLQAVVRYAPETERLIVRRRELLRLLAREAPRHHTADEGDGGDEVETLARDGFAALERLGAEIEAMFVGGAPTPPPRSPVEPRAPEAVRPPAPSVAVELAALDQSLRDQLLTQGVVVRGADIARVVAVATGHQLTWIESLQSA